MTKLTTYKHTYYICIRTFISICKSVEIYLQQYNQGQSNILSLFTFVNPFFDSEILAPNISVYLLSCSFPLDTPIFWLFYSINRWPCCYLLGSTACSVPVPQESNSLALHFFSLTRYLAVLQSLPPYCLVASSRKDRWKKKKFSFNCYFANNLFFFFFYIWLG